MRWAKIEKAVLCLCSQYLNIAIFVYQHSVWKVQTCYSTLLIILLDVHDMLIN